MISCMFFAADIAVLAQQSPSVLETLPVLPENMLATGYSGLQFIAQIENSNMYETCRWTYGREAPFAVFSINIACQDRMERNFTTTCVNNSNHITTGLTVQFPIIQGVVAYVECAVITGNPYAIISSINLDVEGKALP